MHYLKIFKYILFFAVVSSFISCSKDNDIVPSNDLENLQLVTTITNEEHKIELYTANGRFQTGYNDIYFQIKNADGSLVNNAEVTWSPVMQMMNMSHSCPYSSVTKKESTESIYMGYIVFQMAGNEMEHWTLTLDYTIDGTPYSASAQIDVSASPKRVVESFVASDSSRYVLALVAPVSPKVAVNDMKAVVYRMETMMKFVPVEGYKIKIDPRMPGMGNHSSPNNVDLIQGSDAFYYGKLSLTMTGYWKISLQLTDASETVIKGEEITETNEASSIYFEIEF